MTIRLEGITVLADDVQALAEFYERALDFRVEVRDELYVAFTGHGIRVAIYSRPHMGDSTEGHESFTTPRRGQSFEFNFQCESVGEVDRRYAEALENGAVAIGAPAAREWKQHTGFFADPEGNIHSLFADLD